MFKLKPQNVVFWLAAPMIACKAMSNSQIDERVDQMWKIHENRLRQGLGGTFQKTGVYAQGHNQDSL